MKKNGKAGDSPREEISRRAELLSAAARLMREKGYASTTTREMAQAVGMGSGSPFCHFRSKQEILSVIVEEGMTRALARAERLAARGLSPRQRLRALMRLHAETLHGADGDFAAVMLREWPILPSEARQRLDAMRHRYEAIWSDCVQALRDAEHLNGDAVLSARLMLGSLNGSLHWRRGDGPFDARRLANAAADVFLTTPARRPRRSADVK